MCGSCASVAGQAANRVRARPPAAEAQSQRPRRSCCCCCLCVPNAFAAHTAASSLAASLISAALALQQFRFVVADAEGAGGEQQQHQPPRGMQLAITLVNWNTSLRCAGSEGTSTGSSSCWRDMADDTPVLKLRFIDASDARMELEVASWLAEGGFSTISLPTAEVRAVRATLLASSSLIPRSVRAIEVAYLPW